MRGCLKKNDKRVTWLAMPYSIFTRAKYTHSLAPFSRLVLTAIFIPLPSPPHLFLFTQQERLAKNIPRTLENTREFDSSSYLTANPESLRSLHESRGRKRKAVVEEPVEEEESEGDDEEDEDEGDEEMEDEDEAGPSSGKKRKAEASVDADDAENADTDANEVEENENDEAEADTATPPTQPTVAVPRILLTTSPSATRATYGFLQELESVFPGSESYKRLKGRGFELGRIARWAAKRDFQAMIIVNEDHKKPNAITVINLPNGPTAYFKLTSIALSREIAGHARASPHSPELILNNFSTLLGHSVGRLFGSLFPPMPMFRGRQVVTLHNQRDFLFFRRHRYMFASTEKARLQEIGPRFTLKLRWLRKGLPSVLAADGVAPVGGNNDEVSEDEEAPEMQDGEDEDAKMMDGQAEASSEKMDKKNEKDEVEVPALDVEEEFEWKWKPKMEVSRRTFFL